MWPVLTSGLIMGLLSSVHCIGMCGPLVLALPLQQASPRRRWVSVMLYHTGRIITYCVLGLAFGLAGRQLGLAGWQQVFSIVLGLLMVGLCVVTFLHQGKVSFVLTRLLQQKITALNLYLWKAPEKHGFLLLGMGNGLLPCGMVYLAVAAALSTGNAGYSTLFMGFFGLGSLPALAALSFWGYRINMAVRHQFKKAVPFFMLALGIVLVLRGLDLNIPFISPVLPVVPGNAASCH